MAFAQFSQVSLAFGDRDILKNVSLRLAAGSRAGLAGANGSGKSTLMKIMAGLIPADSGDRAIQRGSRVSYLPQSGIVHQGKKLREEAETAFEPVRAMLLRAEGIGGELEKAKSDDGKTALLLDEYHRLQEAVETSGYYQREAAVSSVLTGLGFSEKDLGRDTEEFSGGWQMRIALAKTLLERPDILLLDEPTNYLDIEARSWLEDWLGKFAGGYLLVSHDRYFLDVTVNEVYEIFQGNLKRYAGNYSAYEKTRRQELESLLKRHEAQREEIAKTEALIRRFRYKASKAAFAQELVRRLEKMDRIEIPESLKKISIAFPPPPHSGRKVLTLEGLGKSYGRRRIFSGLDLLVEKGERLLVVGRNGAGKSTLLRILAGADPGFEGSYRYGSGVIPGYFSQDDTTLPDERPGTPGGARAEGAGPAAAPGVLEFLEAEAPTALLPRLRDMLGAFLFRGDDVYKPLSVLSGGERSRLALLRLLLKPMNLLILDEPTNHLDLQSKETLLDTLRAFDGTIVFVSHDRGFMEALSTKTLELAPPGPGRGDAESGAGEPQSRARLFYGNYAYYLERVREESLPEAASRPPVPLKAADRRDAAKQRQTLIRRLERREAEILKALEELEALKAGLEAQLGRPEVYSSGEKARAVQEKLKALGRAIEEKTAAWEGLAEELEEARAGESSPAP
ncbi:MAG: ABC-F family ATP-binding cassette domain-containing protein [Treponema sp.]|jgi:ATP-binding cassette subfamily F protein 3|nr:ABC-F family ATP-binding cassette domain-containing protein [Treponema sp.]